MTDQTPAAGQAPAPAAEVPTSGPLFDFADVTPMARGRIDKHLAQRVNYRGEIMTSAEMYARHTIGKEIGSLTRGGGRHAERVPEYRFMTGEDTYLPVPKMVWEVARFAHLDAESLEGVEVATDADLAHLFGPAEVPAPTLEVPAPTAAADAPAEVPACERCGVALIPDWPGWVHSPALESGLHLPEPNAAARALGDGRTGEVPPADPAAGYTCETCGGALTRDWGGWMHARKPGRVHRVRPNAAARTADAARVMRDTAAAAIVPADPWADLFAALEPSPS